MTSSSVLAPTNSEESTIVERDKHCCWRRVNCSFKVGLDSTEHEVILAVVEFNDNFRKYSIWENKRVFDAICVFDSDVCPVNIFSKQKTRRKYFKMHMLYLVQIAAHLMLGAFFIFCLFSGLFYLSELIEENTNFSKKIIKYTIMVNGT
jgi:hypothetical protein